MSENVRDLFSINRSDWLKTCSEGMNVACLFLVMARGTGKDNRTTSWSANALVQRTGIGKIRAKKAKDNLIEIGIAEVLKEGRHPKFRLSKQIEGELIWLPNSIIDGVNNHTPPLELIRQSGDVYCLKLFIDLYWAQNLVEDFGISRAAFFSPYERKRLGEWRQYVIWGFTRSDHQTLRPSNPVINEQNCKLDKKGETDYSEVWERWKTLQALNLIQYFPHLCDNEHSDSEIIHPMICPFDEDATLAIEAREAAIRAGLSVGRVDDYDFVVPVLKHMKDVALVDIASTKFKVNSKLTNSAYATSKQLIEAYNERFSSIGFTEEEPKTAISRLYQG